MSRRDASLARVEIVARALGDLLPKVAFVGGAALPFYLDPVAGDVRATDDVDCVVEAATRGDMSAIEATLRARGFREDAESGVLCRWRLGDVIVDVMPTDAKALGFSNSWYTEGWAKREARSLPSGLTVYVFPLEYFVASKVEAFAQRGTHDLLASKDLEDLVTLLDGRGDVVARIRSASTRIQHSVAKVLGLSHTRRVELREVVEGNLLQDGGDIGKRLERVLLSIQALSEEQPR